MRSRIEVCLLFLPPALLFAQSPPHFTLTDLGVLPGAASGQATAISASGSITGFSGTGITPVHGPGSGTITGNGQAFIYSNGTMTAIDGSTAVNGSPAAIVIPEGINDSNYLSGVAQVGGQPQPRRFVYEAGQFLNLSIPLPIYWWRINDLNEIAGAGDLTPGTISPILWQNGTVTVLPGGAESVAVGLSPNGQYLGGFMPTGAGIMIPTIWVNQVPQSCNIPAGFDNAEVYAINNAGVGAGMAFLAGGPGGQTINTDTTTQLPTRAAIFYNGQTILLPALPGAFSSFATSINDAGWVVGYSVNLATDFWQIEYVLNFGATSPATVNRHAFLSISGSTYDLTSLVTNAPGWQLTSASDVNSSGQIVGSGLINGQQHAYLLTPAGAGSMAQIASAGTWDTSLTLVNLDSSPLSATLNFSGDPNGGPLPLPFTFPQGVLPPATASTITETINPNALLVLDTTGPASQTESVGWAQLQAPGNVSGFAIFTDPTFGWNALVPLETRNTPSYTLPFDNTGSLATGVAIANVASTAASVPLILDDDTGAQIGTDTLTLAPGGHTSFMLNQKYSAAANGRGTVHLATPAGGQISVLGLRANGTSALTTLPVLGAVGIGGGAIAHVTYNSGFTSVFYLVNNGSAAAQFTLSFFDEMGNALPVPLLLAQSGNMITTSALTQTINAGAMLVIETEAQDALTQVQGSAQLTTAGNISGFEIFRWTTFGQEASVPLETRNPNSFVLVFDDTNGLTTGVAVANLATTTANIVVNLRSDTGALLQTELVSLSPGGHKSFVLPTEYGITSNVRGTAEFVTPAGGRISVIGLRAKSDGTLTTVPVLTK